MKYRKKPVGYDPVNLVEMVEDTVPSPCKHGNIVEHHACYCHSIPSPYRKCPQWRIGEPYEDCEFFESPSAVTGEKK